MRNHRTDHNQKEIVDRYLAHGCSVDEVSKWRPYDLVVAVVGQTDLVEVKNPKQPKSGRELTEGEKNFHAEWRGHIEIVETIDDVDRHVAKLRRRANH